MLKNIFIPSTVALIIGFTTLSNADENNDNHKETEVERLNKIEGFEDLNSTIDELKLLVGKITRQKNLDCLKAFGDKTFCKCISDKTPVGVTFADYIQIVTNSKEELGYSKTTKENKGLIDNSLSAREACGKN